MKIPVLKVTPWQEDAGKKVMGSNPGARKGFFLLKTPLKCSCMIDHLVDIVLYKSVFGLMFYLSCKHMKQLQAIFK